jgi:hypothetical protein
MEIMDVMDMSFHTKLKKRARGGVMGTMNQKEAPIDFFDKLLSPIDDLAQAMAVHDDLENVDQVLRACIALAREHMHALADLLDAEGYVIQSDSTYGLYSAPKKLVKQEKLS